MDTVVSKSVEVRPASPARPPVLRNGTTITGSIVAFAHGVMLGYFFGWAWCAAWCVVSIAVLIWLVKDTVAARGGDAKAEARSYVTQFALITLWMASAGDWR